LDDVDYTTNRFSTSSLELPFEIRWRTSTATEYKFWRIYTGVRMSYTYWYSAYFKQTDNKVVQTKISEFQPLNFAFTFAFGYSTFNFYVNYSLTPFFKDAYTEDTMEEIGFRPLKLGLIFYIL
jgi:Outer membrane protein beta-barrel domain